MITPVLHCLFVRRAGRPMTALLLALPITLTAQGTTDTLTLGALHRLAQTVDPRARQASLLREQSAARQASIRREWLPVPTGQFTGQYLSDVPSVGGVPGIGPIGPLNHQYDAQVTLRQTLLDPTRASRQRVEAQQLAESEAALRSTLYGQRLQVNDAFFAVLHRQVQQRVHQVAIDDLTERRRLMQRRVEAGSALPSEALQLDAELVRRQQALAEARSEEAVARYQLADLTGHPIAPGTVLLPPSDGPAADPSSSRARPEYALFDRSRSLLRERDATAAAKDRPRLSFVTRTGYGRPGLNALGRTFDSYVSTGVQIDWTPWNWGATSREREILRATAQTIETNERAFTQTIRRAANADEQRLQLLATLAEEDEQILILRERILAEARVRYDEGELTTADYINRASELLTATLDRESRRVRMAETRARYLTTIGQEIR